MASEPEQENLWNKILSEASRSVSDRLETKTVLVLGDKNSGKSTLIARMQGMDISEMRKGIALDYSFIDIHSSEADDDTLARLNIWQLEGDIEHKDLLKFALNPSNITNSLVVIALDYSQPWNLIESLNRWLNVLQKHISSVSIQLPPGSHQELKNSLIYDFQNYVDPSSNTGIKTVQTKKKRPIDEQSLLPLKDGVLTNNFGVPIIIVCCKTDNFTQLEKEYNYKEIHYDYIQQYIRRICLSYGAALVYTSAKKDRNCDTLLRYIRHQLYGLEFEAKPQMQEKDILFIPLGSDSTAKITVDFESQNLTKDPDEPFEDVIKIPTRLQQKAATTEPLIIAEDDQEYLNRHKDSIEKDKAQEAKKGPSSKDTGIIQTIKNYSPSGNTTTENVLTGVTSPSLTPSFPKTPSANSLEKTMVQPVSSLANPDLSKGDNQVLADFFNSLINKDPHRPAIATGLPRKTTGADLKSSLLGTSTARTTPSTLPSSREEIAKQLDKLKGSTKPTTQ